MLIYKPRLTRVYASFWKLSELSDSQNGAPQNVIKWWSSSFPQVKLLLWVYTSSGQSYIGSWWSAMTVRLEAVRNSWALETNRPILMLWSVSNPRFEHVHMGVSVSLYVKYKKYVQKHTHAHTGCWFPNMIHGAMYDMKDLTYDGGEKTQTKI